MAGVVDLLNETNMLLLRAHFDLKHGPPEPTPIPRPGGVVLAKTEEPERPPATIHDFRRALLG